MNTSPKSLLLFVLCRRKISWMMDLFRERSDQKLKPVIQRNKRADRAKGGRGSPVRKTELLLFMFHPSGSHYFPRLPACCYEPSSYHSAAPLHRTDTFPLATLRVCRVQNRKEMEYPLSTVVGRSRMTKLAALGAKESGKGRGREGMETGDPFIER